MDQEQQQEISKRSQRKLHLLDRLNLKLSILIIGAGGIGCELIKNLYKTNNFITLIDYDTVSPSNLNRQFCFSPTPSLSPPPKPTSLFSYFSSLNPNLSFHLKPLNKNILQLDQLFFSQFDIMILAVDNLEARQFINMRGIEQGIRVIDAGTGGYGGQIWGWARGESECRGCRKGEMGREGNEQVNVCGVRGVPGKNLHCVHFGMELYKQFCNLSKILKSQKQTQKSGITQSNPFLKYFSNSFSSLSLELLYKILISIHNNIFSESLPSPPSSTSSQNSSNPTQINYPTFQSQKIFPKIKGLKNGTQFNNQRNFVEKMCQITEENEQFYYEKEIPRQIYSWIFLGVLEKILETGLKVKNDKENNEEELIFDKDDMKCVLFVYSVANLRIANYKDVQKGKLKHISFYQCKDMAGKIIPALASTNSIAAALQTLYLTKLFSSKPPKFNYQTIKNFSPFHPLPSSCLSQSQPQPQLQPQLMPVFKVQPLQTHSPKPLCPYCSPLFNYIQLQMNFSLTKWQDFQQFVAERFDQSLKERDVRSQGYVVIRNSGRKEGQEGIIKGEAKGKGGMKEKFLGESGKLIKISEIGVRIIVVGYLSSGKEVQMIWKFVLCDVGEEYNQHAFQKNKKITLKQKPQTRTINRQQSIKTKFEYMQQLQKCKKCSEQLRIKEQQFKEYLQNQNNFVI